jgi:hypothetical protein
MPLDLSEVTNDPDLGSPVVIIRTTGAFAAGGWKQNEPTEILAFGVVSIADDEALAQVPEGDRVIGALEFVTAQHIYPTLAGKSGTSDKIRWLGNLYRVVSIQPWKHMGFFSAILVRMTGE